MKLPAYILIIALISSLVACKQSNQTSKQTAIVTDSTKVRMIKKEQEPLERRRQLEAEAKEDSLRMDKVMNKALEIAYQNIGADTFTKAFETVPDSLYSVAVTLKMDHFFSKKFKHLIIHREHPSTVYIDIYLKQNNRFTKVASHEQWLLEYTRDTLKDVNGDGLKDLLVNWYGNNGCCLKNFYDVYLFQPETGTFSEGYEFINPTFSASEKIIRGVEYGHPGETEMYKYKWAGLSIDTVEIISYEKNKEGIKTGKVIRERYLQNNTQNKKIEQLKSVPKEYRRIYGYDWFTGNI